MESLTGLLREGRKGHVSRSYNISGKIGGFPKSYREIPAGYKNSAENSSSEKDGTVEIFFFSRQTWSNAWYLKLLNCWLGCVQFIQIDKNPELVSGNARIRFGTIHAETAFWPHKLWLLQTFSQSSHPTTNKFSSVAPETSKLFSNKDRLMKTLIKNYVRTQFTVFGFVQGKKCHKLKYSWKTITISCWAR